MESRAAHAKLHRWLIRRAVPLMCPPVLLARLLQLLVLRLFEHFLAPFVATRPRMCLRVRLRLAQ